jgi:metal-responsive CopG/Arc/MetJ family transcriptional regulator
VEYTQQYMETIQVVLESALLRATDQAARKRQLNRSALVREALRAHLRRLAARDREQRDREGYRRRPSSPEEFGAWDAAAAWPDE